MTESREPASQLKPKLEISRRADIDIENILLYTTQTWGRAQRSRYRRILSKAIRSISENPEIGKAQADLFQGARSLVVSEHVIYYMLSDELILIVRVLHAHQDVATELG